MIHVHMDNTIEGYRQFIRIKQLPRYEIHGRMAVVPDEYASLLGQTITEEVETGYRAKSGLFDYQRDIVKTAIKKRKFAIFADCGLGKTLMLLEFARHVRRACPAGVPDQRPRGQDAGERRRAEHRHLGRRHVARLGEGELGDQQRHGEADPREEAHGQQVPKGESGG